MTRTLIASLLLLSACTTPLPCVFNDTPECEARWRPVMERQATQPIYIPNPAPTAPPPPAYGTPGNPAYCHAQSAGYNTMITCQ